MPRPIAGQPNVPASLTPTYDKNSPIPEKIALGAFTTPLTETAKATPRQLTNDEWKALKPYEKSALSGVSNKLGVEIAALRLLGVQSVGTDERGGDVYRTVVQVAPQRADQKATFYAADYGEHVSWQGLKEVSIEPSSP
jgi:hypothetical protein